MPFANKISRLDARKLEALAFVHKPCSLEQRSRVHSVLNVGRPPLAVFTDQAAVDSIVTAGSILIDRDVRVAITLGVPQALG